MTIALTPLLCSAVILGEIEGAVTTCLPIGYPVYVVKLSEWPTKTEAAELIGVSVKTLERYADDRKIEQRLRPRPGRSPIAMFNPRDVDAWRQSVRRQRVGRLFVMPQKDDATTAPVSTLVPLPHDTAAIAPASFADALRMMAEASALRVPLAEKPRVTMAEAIALGFTRENLREMVAAGRLENVGTPHRYRFRRRDLDAL